jgi:N-acetylmuramoyl-L-alanine amidase
LNFSTAAAFLFIFLVLLSQSSALAAQAGILNDVRYTAYDDYVRVVLDVSAAVGFDKRDLRGSNKVYIDLKNTTIGKFKRKIIDVGNPVLTRIRTGQFDSKTVRIVFDLESSADVKVFMLSSPERIVIDIYGEKKDKGAASKETPETQDKTTQDKTTQDKTTQDKAVQDSGKNKSDDKPRNDINEKKPASDDKDQKKINENGVQPPASENGAQPPASKDTPKKDAPKKDAPQKEPPAKDEKKGSVIEKVMRGGTVKTAKKKAGSQGSAAGLSGSAVPGRKEVASKRDKKPFEPTVKRVVIDPGHGGHDTGAIGKTGLREKDVVLEISLLLADVLREKYHYEVYMTRSTDEFIPLDKRTEFANSKRADLFISVHVNANQEESVRGVETYFLNWTNNAEAMRVAARENDITFNKMAEVQTELGDILTSLARESKRNESLRLANYVHRSLVDSLNSRFDDVRDLGVKQALFYVLIGSSMPAALVELSFITNENEEKLLKDDTYKENLSQAVAKGISRYFSTLPGAPAYARAAARKTGRNN